MFEFLSHPIPSVVLLLGLLVFVHEFGHFFVGKLCGVGVEIFSIGFGPRLFGFTLGTTDYRISGIPLGGYVKFAGALPSEEVPGEFVGRELFRAAVWKRMLILIAGPLGNLLLAVSCYMILGMAGIQQPSSVIGEVRSGSPAEKAGLMSGDQVVQIGSREIVSWKQLQSTISESAGKELELTILRNGAMSTVNLRPEPVQGEDFLGRPAEIGRAGIGYGFLPAKISLLGSGSVASAFGLRTGDLITEVNLSGRAIPVSSWAEFMAALSQAFEKQVQTIELTLQTKEVAGSNKPSQTAVPRPTAKLSVPTNVWESTRAELSGLRPADLRRKLAELLGITDGQLTIEQLEEPSSKTLKKDDRIISFDGKSIQDIYYLHEVLDGNRKKTVPVQVQRGDSIVDLDVELKPIDVQKPSGLETIFILAVSFGGAGVEPPPYIERYGNPLSALLFGITTTTEQSWVLVKTIAGLFTGDVPLKALGGPMLIAKVAGDSVKLGWQAFLTSTSLISINLGMINLFPIPVLDGGQLVIAAIEGIRRRRLSEAAIENYQKVGFVMIMSLVVLATYNDLSRFWRSMVEGVAGLF
jgi:regulator of sigma E protease